MANEYTFRVLQAFKDHLNVDILISGSIAFDYLMRFSGRFRDSLVEQKLDKVSLSFLVEDMRRHFGGVAANIAYTMALLGQKPRLMGTVGQDFGDYYQHLKSVGVDCSTVIHRDEVFTASFFSNTDDENNQIASFYAGAMALAGAYRMVDVTDKMPDYVVVSPDDPEAMEARVNECRAKDIPYLYDPSQQVARLDGSSLKHGIEECHMMMCNEYEWSVIEKRTNYTIDKMRDNGQIFIYTQGEVGAKIYTPDAVYDIPAYAPRAILNPTGAGDAFRAGILRGMILDLPWEVTGRIGALCGTYALQHHGTQEHHFTPQSFVEHLRKLYNDEGALDALLK